MNLEECDTIKKCLYWAEGEWPGFWDFANLAPMSYEEMVKLSKSISNSDKFDKLLNQLSIAAKQDKSKEGISLLIKGTKAFTTLQENINEHTKIKKSNQKRRNK